MYSNFGEKKIFDIGYIYDMYQLINGVSEFVNTGNATQLKTLYDGNSENALINAINNFSETLSLCALSRLDDSYKELRNAISDFENMNNINGMYSQIFKTLLGTIKNKMPFVMNDYVGKEYRIYPELIKWCVNNGMLQQALTIYTEKMPIYYFNVYKKELSEFVNLEKIELNVMDSSKEAKGFYTDLFSKINEGVLNCNQEINSKEDNFSTDVKLWADKLKEADELKKADLVKELNSFINSMEDKEISPNYQELIYVVKDIVENNYYKNGNRKKEARKWLPTKVDKYVNTMDKKISNLMKTISTKSSKKQKENTYKNKLSAIRIMNPENNTILDSNQEKIFNAMKYYVAVKMVRNLVNHANDTENSIDEGIINEMKSYEIEINTNTDNVKKILLDGLEKTT